jgi:hypothetical protein
VTGVQTCALPIYEVAAAVGVNNKLGDTFKMLAWQFL